MLGRLIVILLLALNTIYGADRYWVAGASGNWNNTTNWSTTSGGAGGASVPSVSDAVFFDGGGLGECTIDSSPSIASLSMSAGYIGGVAFGTYTLTVAGDADLRSGVPEVNFFNVLYTGSRNDFSGNLGYGFTPTSTMSIVALGRPVSGSMLGNHPIRIWRVSDQSIVASVTVTPASAVDALGCKFETLAVPVTLQGGVAYRISSLETSGGDAWFDFGNISNHRALATISTDAWSSGDVYPVNGGGSVDTGYIAPTYYAVQPRFSGTSGGLIVSANGTLTPPALGTIPNVTVAGGTTTLATNNLSVASNLTLSGGNLTANGRSISVAGNWENSVGAGGFTAGTGTVTLNGAGGSTQVISGNTTFDSLTATCTTARTLNFTAGTTQTIDGTLTLAGASGQLLSLRSTTPTSTWTMTPNGTRACSYVDVRDGINTVSPAIDPPTSINSGNNTLWFTMPPRYWVAAVSSNWNNTANWSTTSGGAGGASVPTAVDAAFFTGGGLGNCVVDISANAVSLTMVSAYTGILAFGANTITVAGNADMRSGGTFTGSTGGLVISATGSLISPAATTIPNLTVSSGTLTLANNDLNVDRQMSVASVFAFGGRDVNVGALSVTSAATFTVPSGRTLTVTGAHEAEHDNDSNSALELYWPCDEQSGTVLTDASGNARNGSFSSSAGYFSAGRKGGAVFLKRGQTATASPSPNTGTNFSVGWWTNPTTLTNFNSDIGWGWGQWRFYTNSNGDVYCGTDVSTRFFVSGVMTRNVWQYWTYTMSGGTATLYLNGTVIATGAQTATVGGGTFTMSDDCAFDEVRVWSRAITATEVQNLSALPASLYVTSTSTLNVLGSLSIGGILRQIDGTWTNGSSSSVNFTGRADDAGVDLPALDFHHLTVTNPGTSFRLPPAMAPIISESGNWRTVCGVDGGAIASDYTNYPSYATVNFSGAQLFTWATSATDTRGLQRGLGWKDRIESTWYNAPNFDIDISINDAQSHLVTLYCLDYENGGRAQTVTWTDVGTNTVLFTDNMSGYGGGAYLSHTISGHVVITVTGTGSGNQAVVSGIFFGGPVPRSAGPLTINGDLSLSGGNLGANGRNLTVVGNWINNIGVGGFAGGSSTVTLSGANGSTQNLSGNTIFNALTATGTLARTIQFNAGSNQTVNGALTLSGATGQLLSLRSSATPSTWTLTPNGTRTCSYVQVTDGINAAVPAISPSFSVDGGNNTEWWLGTNRYWRAKQSPLDSISTASVAAYGLRRLRTAYSGPAIRIRRSSDDAELDIGFELNGELQAELVAGFVGGNSGYIKIWYDQSGNARDATQGTSADQPRIVNAGTIDTQSGRPTAVFLQAQGLQSTLTNIQATTSGTDITMNAVFQADNGVSQALLGYDAGPNDRILLHAPWSDGNTYVDIGNSSSARFSGALTWSTLAVGTFSRAGNQGYVFKNGAQILSTSSLSGGVTSSQNIWIGSASGNYPLRGRIAEIVFFPSGLNSTERQVLENSQGSYFALFGTPNVWSNPNNWSESISGPTGDPAPTAADTVYFDSNGTASCVVDVSANAASVSMAAGYIGTLALGTNTLTVAGNADLRSGGTFTGTSGGLVLSATSTLSPPAATSIPNVTIIGGVVTLSVNDLSVAHDVNISGGNVSANGRNIRLAGNWTNSVGNSGFAAGSGAVIFSAVGGSTQTLNGDTTYNNLTASGSLARTLQFTAGSTQTVNGAFALSGAAGQLLSLRSSVTGSPWYVIPNGTRTCSYLNVEDGTNNVGPTINPLGYSRDNGNNVQWFGTDRYWSPSGATLLDRLNAPSAAAYGLRTLRSAYVGPLVRVRRSSDNGEQNISSTGNGVLDVAAVTAFVGSGVGDYGYVSVWYDQSGGGLNAVQPTLGNQPRLINAGTVELLGGQPALRFSGAPVALITSGVPVAAYPISLMAVAEVAGSTNGAFIKLGGNLDGIGLGIGAGDFDSPGFTFTGLKENRSWDPSIYVMTAGTPALLGYVAPASGASTFLFNGVSSSGVGNSPLVPTTQMNIGGYLTRIPDCLIAEALVFGSTLDATDRQALFGWQAGRFAGTGYGTPTDSTRWSDSANWSTISGGGGGASVPTAANNVYFDGNGLGTCSVDVPANAASVTMAAGYTNAVAFGANTLTVVSSADLRSGGTFTGSTGGLALSATGTLSPPAATTIPSLTITGGTATLATNALSVSGNLTISGGNLTANGRSISVAGNWANSVGAGGFTAGTGTVTLNGAGGSTQVISGNTTFDSLTATCTTARTLNFTAGSTQVVGGTMTLTGASGQLLSLRSTATPTVWNLTPNGTRTCNFVDVRDGTNTVPPAIEPATFTNSGNNVLWGGPDRYWVGLKRPLSVLSAPAAVAYGLRALSETYSGPAVRIRRSSDNTEQDVGFTASGDLDTSALLAFVGGGDGFVTVWYDQSGSTGRDASQNTTAYQPLLVSSGVTCVRNGVPTIRFDGVDDLLVSATANYAFATLNAVWAYNVGSQMDYAGFFSMYDQASAKCATSDTGLNITSVAPNTTVACNHWGTSTGAWFNGSPVASLSDFNNYQVGCEFGTSLAILTHTQGMSAGGTKAFVIGADCDYGPGSRQGRVDASELMLLGTVTTTERQNLEAIQGDYFAIGGVPAGSAVWSDSNNWAYSSGGARGAPVPIATNTVWFDAQARSGCTLDVAGVGSTVTFASGFTRTFAFGTNTLTTTGTTDLRSGGTFTGSTGGLILAGSGAQTLTPPATGTIPNLTVTAGTTTLATNSLAVAGNLTVNAGTLIATQDIRVAGNWSNFGSFISGQLVTLACGKGAAVVRYTTDGTAPTNASSVYSTPIVVTAGSLVRATAFVGGVADAAAVYIRLGNAPTSNLVGHWKLDDAAGTTAADDVGASPGTLIGAPAWTTGPVGGALAFDYTNGEDYVALTNTATLQNVQEGDYTLSAWFRPDSVPPGGGSANDAYYSVIVKSGNHLGITYDNAQHFGATHWLTGGFPVGVGGAAAYAPGFFHHVALVVSKSAGTMKMYVDGGEVGSNTFTPGTAAFEYNAADWRLGMGEPGGVAYGWPCHGAIDDARIYSRALSASEIVQCVGITGSATASATTVTLNGAGGSTQVISGTTTFSSLTATCTTARTLEFTAGTTQTVAETMTLTGASGQLLSLRSTTPASTWSLTPSGTRTCSYVDVQDGTNTVSPAVNPASSVDSGNTTLWFGTDRYWTPTPSSNTPLDRIAASSAAGYSLRRLRVGYAGSAIRVRRSSDGTSQDIGFAAGGGLDTAALATFVGGGSGYVRIWYDQSGNGRDAVQTTDAAQPRIVNAGTIETKNGVPTLRFEGTMKMPSWKFAAPSTAFSMLSVASVDNNTGNNANVIGCDGDGYANNGIFLQFQTGCSYIASRAGAVTVASVGSGVSAGQLVTTGLVHSAGGSATAYVDGTAGATQVLDSWTTGSSPTYDLGFYPNASISQWGCYAEHLVFATALSASDRRYLESSQALFYTLSGPAFDSASWSVPENWSYASGGPGGAPAPTSANAVYFEAGSSIACTIDAASNAASLSMVSGYIGTLVFGTNTLSIAGNADLRSGGALTGSTGGLLMSATGTLYPPAATTIPNLNVTGGTTTLATNNLSVARSLTISGGNLTANGRSISVAGNWANSVGAGGFTSGTGTVTLNGAGGSTQVISGNTTFDSLTATCTTARTLNFTAGTTQTIGGTLTLIGASGQLLSLRSTTPTSVWMLTPSGTRTCSYMDVQDATNTTAPAINPLSSVNSGNTTLWFGTDRYWVAPTAAPPLDAVSASPTATYGLRKLRTAYAGSAIRVRRSSDNAEQDIGFAASNDFDTVALTAFVGVNSGYVKIWYDQSGNGRDASQTSAVDQPRIVDAGTIETQGGRPAVRFFGSGNGRLSTASFTAYGAGWSSVSTAKVRVNLAGNKNTIVNKSAGYLPAPFDFHEAEVYFGRGSPYYQFYNLATPFDQAAGQAVYSFVHPASGIQSGFINGAANGSNTSSGNDDLGDPLTIGGRNDSFTALDGWISEVLTFGSAISVADRQSLETSQDGYFAISGAATAWSSQGNWSYTSGGVAGAPVPTAADVTYFDGGSTVTCDVDVAATSASITMANSYTGILAFGNNALTVAGTADLRSGGTFTGSTGGIVLSATGTLIPPSATTLPNVTVTTGIATLATNNLNVAGTLSISGGNLIANGRSISVAGNWANSVGVGGFSAGTGTVTLNGAGGSTQVISGNTTFDSLTATCTAQRTLQFTAGTTQTVGGTLTLNGVSGQQLRLRSTVDGSIWTLTPSGTRNCSLIDVKDGTNTVGPAINPESSADSGNTTLWFGTARYWVAGRVPLDAVAGQVSPTATYALRKLRAAYAGAAVRVRRSLDDAEQNIGFAVNGDLDTSALNAFVAGSSGYVTTWYDQSGNGHDAAQTVSTDQPRIVDAGTIEIQGGRPAIRFFGTGAGRLSTVPFTAYNGGWSSVETAKVRVDFASENTIVSKANSNLPAPFDHWENTVFFGNGGGYNAPYTLTTALNVAAGLATWSYSHPTTGTQSGFVNGIANGSGTSSGNGDSGTPLCLGGRNDSGTRLDGWISEVLTFGSAISDADRQSLEASQGTYFAIPGTVAVWSSPGNWAYTSGGAGGASVPTAADAIYFDANGTISCTVDVAANASSVTMVSGYTGALAFGTNTLAVAGSADLRSGGVFTGSSGGLSLSATGSLSPPAATTIPSLTITGGTATLATNTLSVAGNLTISGGNLTANGRNISVVGNWANTAGAGGFTAGTGTVTLNGAGGSTQVLSGNTTFDSLTATCTMARTLNFTAGTTQTIGGTLTLTGASGQLLSLRSTTPTSTWTLTPNGTRTCSYVDVQDGTNTVGPAINPLYATDSGNTTLWFGTDRYWIPRTAVLDAVSVSSAGSFGLRKLYATYGGAAIRVRRSNDSVEQDIGFTGSGDLDTAALTTFVGTNSAYVTIWYDQSGNARDAVQTTASSQPRIVNAGTIDTQNGRPAVLFLGAQGLLTGVTNLMTTTSGTDITISLVTRANNGVNQSVVGADGYNNTDRVNIHAPWSNGVTYWDVANAGGGRISGALTWPSLAIGTFRRAGVQSDVWKNGTNVLSSGSVSGSIGSTQNLWLGCAGSPALNALQGHISEAIFFPAGLVTADRTELEGSQGDYFAIGGVPAGSGRPAAYGRSAVWSDRNNWAFSSGGAQGAPIPTAANAVWFDALGLTGCTLDVAGTCSTATFVSGYTGTLAFGTNTLTVAGSADLRSGGTFTGSTGGLALSATGSLSPPAATAIPNLTVTGGTATLATNALSVAGNLTISGGNLTANSLNISVAGNWANSVGAGGFTAGSGAVIFNGAGGSTQVVSGNTTFNVVTATATLARTLQFAAGSTQTVAGTLTLNGASAQRLSLRSSIAGSAWRVDPQGARSCSWLDVQDGRNLRLPVIDPLSSIDAGGTTWWFGQTIGLCWDGATTGATEGQTSPVTWPLGVLNVGAVRTSGVGLDAARAFVVRNVGDQMVKLVATATSSGWSIGPAAGFDTCALAIAPAATFTSLDPVTSPTGVTLTSALSAGTTQPFALRLGTPVGTNSAGIGQTLTVTLSAGPPP